MSKANKKARFFIKRGEIISTLNFNDEEIKMTLVIPTNYQNDKLVEEYTSIEHGSMDIRGADLLEARLMNFVIDLSFEIPLDEELKEYAMWKDANEDQRRIAIRLMDPDLRDLINEELMGKGTLSEDTVGN
jgi:hypothetical protein